MLFRMIYTSHCGSLCGGALTLHQLIFAGHHTFSLTMADPVEITIVRLGQTLEGQIYIMCLNFKLCLMYLH